MTKRSNLLRGVTLSPMRVSLLRNIGKRRMQEVKGSSSPYEAVCSLCSAPGICSSVTFLRNSFWQCSEKVGSRTMFQDLSFEMGDFQRRSFCLGNSQQLTILPIPCQAFSLGFLSLVLLLNLLASMRFCFSSVLLYLSARSPIRLGTVL